MLILKYATIIQKNMANDLQIIIDKDKIKIINKNSNKQKLLEKLKGGKNGNKSNL